MTQINVFLEQNLELLSHHANILFMGLLRLSHDCFSGFADDIFLHPKCMRANHCIIFISYCEIVLVNRFSSQTEKFVLQYCIFCPGFFQKSFVSLYFLVCRLDRCFNLRVGMVPIRLVATLCLNLFKFKLSCSEFSLSNLQLFLGHLQLLTEGLLFLQSNPVLVLEILNGFIIVAIDTVQTVLERLILHLCFSQ